MEVKAQLKKEDGTENISQQEASYSEFKDIFRQYYPRVVRKVWTIVQNKQASEDVAQEVFMKLYHTDWESIEHLPAWLMTTSVHTAYNRIRSEKRHDKRLEKESHYMEQEEASLEENVLRQENITEVQEILHSMSERDRTILLLKYSGFPYRDIADAVGVEVTSIGTLLARAKRRFKNIYASMKGEE
ncbi:RNA polymerase sigma factor SigX [Pontibacillus salicampi]|uniref:RNA polymerase sigma factor SigX n=1 Tax=Pontibacillus salicampi TaxID=1449801 RepID=A0ABV6LPY0_9BACI